MARLVTYGQQPTEKPPHGLRPIHFEPLMLTDTGTVEGYLSRLFESDGGGVRDAMPLTISMQYTDASGHDMAVPVGALHEVTIDGENQQVTAKGWLVDTDDGRLAEIMVASGAMHHNSADIGEVPPNGLVLEYDGDPWDDDFRLTARFKEWKVAKTTLVSQPAFAKAKGTLPEIVAAWIAELDGEITASLGSDEPLVITTPALASAYTPVEVMAAATSLPPWDYFHRPESDVPHKLHVEEPDENGWCHIYGHLAKWNEPHTSMAGQVYAPRSRDDYATFCQPSVLTDRGMVRAGPVVLYGGHISLKDAADDPKNAWADVRVSDGKHGPWVSGVARPHIAHEMAERYVARASRISGHWKTGVLRMIVSVSAEGYPIAYQPEADELVASFDEVSVMAPGGGALVIPQELLSLDEITPEAQRRILDWARLSIKKPGETLAEQRDYLAGQDDEWDADAAYRARQRELELEAEDQR